MRLHKETRPTQAWIIHGFRGKREQALQYITEGFYLSYGTKFNKEALLCTPIDKLFIERDEDRIPLAQHYNNISDILGVTTEKLAATIEQNCLNCGIDFTNE
jgi:TatD DNase family protein